MTSQEFKSELTLQTHKLLHDAILCDAKRVQPKNFTLGNPDDKNFNTNL